MVSIIIKWMKSKYNPTLLMNSLEENSLPWVLIKPLQNDWKLWNNWHKNFSFMHSCDLEQRSRSLRPVSKCKVQQWTRWVQYNSYFHCFFKFHPKVVPGCSAWTASTPYWISFWALKSVRENEAKKFWFVRQALTWMKTLSVMLKVLPCKADGQLNKNKW